MVFEGRFRSTFRIAAYSVAGVSVAVPVVAISTGRRVSDSVGLAPPTNEQLHTENPKKNSPLIRHLPVLEHGLAWRSLGAFNKSPIHTCEVPSLSGERILKLFVKREDLLSPLYGGNKVRTLQHQLAVCEARRERGEKGFKQLVSVGSGGSNQIVACTVHARALGWDGTNDKAVNPCWFDKDEPDLDNTLNMLSVLSLLNIGGGSSSSSSFKFNWGESPSPWTFLKAILGVWRQDEFIPMMLGGNCPSGVMGQIGAVLELAEQIAAGECPANLQRIYVPVGSACTVSGLVIGTVLARRLGLPGLSHPDFKIIGCNVHDGMAKYDAIFNFHVNPLLGFVPLTITHTIISTCAALKQLGGPDLEADALEFVKHSLKLKTDAEVVGLYGGHSNKSRIAAQLYDEKGKVIDANGKEAKNLWVCGHFVAKAFQPLLIDLEKAEDEKDNNNKSSENGGESPCYMLWMTKSAVQPRGNQDEWSRFLQENKTVQEWANNGKAESPKFRPGKVTTTNGTAEDYRSIMTKII